jgi:hypothetical protein
MKKTQLVLNSRFILLIIQNVYHQLLILSQRNYDVLLGIFRIFLIKASRNSICHNTQIRFGSPHNITLYTE